MSTTFDSARVAELAGQVSGSVLGPEDLGYDAARAVHNGLVDRRPALIVRCRTTNDVIAALSFARRAGLEVSIRGGGHNVAGRAVTDGGVMVDLAEMKGSRSIPRRRPPPPRAVSLGGAELRGRPVRAGRDRWRGLRDGHRRLHARRRPWLADGQVRTRRGQPAGCRARHGRGRRTPRRRRRPLSLRSLLGASRRPPASAR
jgi:hypothetical protein